MRLLTPYRLDAVDRQLETIRPAIQDIFPTSFPKAETRWLSHYQFNSPTLRIEEDGFVHGGYTRLLSHTFDLRWIRPAVAPYYSSRGGHCYDPASLVLVEIAGYLDGCRDVQSIANRLRDASQGASLRRYAGLSGKHLPSGDDFTNLHQRLGEEGYLTILHGFVEIASRLGLVTGRIRTHDGTLFSTRANYRGCAYFCQDCQSISVEKLVTRVKRKVQHILKHQATQLGKEKRVSILCSSQTIPEDKKPPRIPVLRFKLHRAPHPKQTQAINQPIPKAKRIDPPAGMASETRILARLLGIDDLLQQNQLTIEFLSFPFDAFELEGDKLTKATCRCPRLPADTEARCGFRRDRANSNKTEMVFGFDTVTTLSIEPQLGLELPIACSTGPGSLFEGHSLPNNLDQIQRFHPQLAPKIDIADCGYDDINCYQRIRQEGSIPLIDYNVRNENLSQDGLIKRGYNAKGTPLTSCSLSLPMTHNGYDAANRRHTYCCWKVCQKLDAIPACPHLANRCGYTTHMTIKELPRLVLEIPRESHRFRRLHNFRSASERFNSTAKDDLHILENPRTMGINAAQVLGVIAAIVVLLKRILDFIIRCTTAFRFLMEQLGDQPTAPCPKELIAPNVPTYLVPFCKRE